LPPSGSCAQVHEIDKRSIALAQALEFELGLRRKDGLGEWLASERPGFTDIIDDPRRWLFGPQWRRALVNPIAQSGGATGPGRIGLNKDSTGCFSGGAGCDLAIPARRAASGRGRCGSGIIRRGLERLRVALNNLTAAPSSLSRGSSIRIRCAQQK
jgi:hypothetical protein